MGILAGVTVQLREMGISEESASASTEIHSEIVNIRGDVRDVAELVDGNQAAPQKSSAMSNRPQREIITEANAIAP